jgi:hypothetical protein
VRHTKGIKKESNLHMVLNSVSPGRRISTLTLILLTSTKWWAAASASKWRMGFNSAFKGLIVGRDRSSQNFAVEWVPSVVNVQRSTSDQAVTCPHISTIDLLIIYRKIVGRLN